jgi:excinuclease ABC subunit B
MVKHTKKEMEKMAKNLNFMEATRLRDELQELEKNLKNKA